MASPEEVLLSDVLQMQVTVAAPPPAIFAALTAPAALATWFAESADVALAEGRYDFWGRFTPEVPDREAGRHPLLAAEPDRRLSFGWRVLGLETVVEFTLVPRDTGTVVVLQHRGLTKGTEYGFYPLEDFWFLSLENLRRHVAGKAAPIRCDFTLPDTGDVRLAVEIAGERAAVYAALIRPEELERWIASDATVEPVVGGRYDVGWGADPMKILELVPDERLAYAGAMSPDGPEMVVTWTLEGSGGRTRLTLVHSGFAPDQRSDDLRNGWLNFLSFVKSLVEDGAGWTPPILALSPEIAQYYAGSIGRGQGALVLTDR
jgi:uncharacterized protein YndB with AHSA1/START domain